MLALFDNERLCFLNFVDSIYKSPEYIQQTSVTSQKLKEELEQYFSGNLKNFTIKTLVDGTTFQNKVWHGLLTIPYGKTISYKEQSEFIGCKSSFRAVANANGKNKIAIIAPCHRVIRNNGNLGGYAGGTNRKQWLLEHEYKNSTN